MIPAPTPQRGSLAFESLRWGPLAVTPAAPLAAKPTTSSALVVSHPAAAAVDVVDLQIWVALGNVVTTLTLVA